MENFEITKIKLQSIIDNIEEYSTDASIDVPNRKLKEGLDNGNLSFELFVFHCETISNWYDKYLISIINNEWNYNKDVHKDNSVTIKNIIKDIQNNEEEYKDYFSGSKIKKANPLLSEDKVFIVHGHDDGLKNEVARFLEKFGLKPIILHEQASGGKTIIEKIEKHSNVGFGIVLYTPCDIGAVATNPKELKNRARQNVVFEHGYLIGKLGRENTVALIKGDIETPNDFSGVVYIPYAQSDGWKTDIAKELKIAGYNIDMNKLFE